ncbi:MAG: phosphopantetheine-binding protein [Myxococcota bacterium]
MSNSNSVKSDIRTFLSRHVRGVEVKDSDDIFVMGLVNSLFAMQLVEFTEKTFSIQIGPEDLNMDNFRTINAIAELIERKSARGSGGEA